jgi:arginase
LAVKINRQMNSIALLGVPTSAASLASGHERGPAAWRAAGLPDRLREAGFTVTDYGDCVERTFAPDDEHPRARNAAQVLAMLEELRPKVEVAVKSAALPLVLGGDDSIVLATIAGCRRYYRNVGLIYFDRDAGLNEPATTPSGCVDGMVISHVIGRGAPELVRFWNEPPLVREPQIALVGIHRSGSSSHAPCFANILPARSATRARLRPHWKRSNAYTDCKANSFCTLIWT